MSIDISRALSDGLNRSLKRSGGILFVVFLVLETVSMVAMQSASDTLFPQALQRFQEMSSGPLPTQFTQLLEGPQPLAASIPLWVAISLFFMVAVLGQTARVLSDRTFISSETEGLHEPRRWIGWATLSSIGGSIVIFALFFLLYLPVGVLLIVSPLLLLVWAVVALITAIVLSVSFLFFRQEIASRDIGPVDALSDSWSLVKGNRLEVLGLILLLTGITLVVDIVGGLLFGLFSLRAGAIAGLFIGAALFVFDSAVVAQAYCQLRTEKRDVDTNETSDGINENRDTDTDDEWEPDEKWNDPPL
jgi:hypothetical protein